MNLWTDDQELRNQFGDCLIADVHEPPEFGENFKKTDLPYCYLALNEKGFADYLWWDHEAKPVQLERKQWGELLGGLDSVENQLRNHLQRRPECRTGLLVEGLFRGTANGTTVLRGTSKNNIYVGGYEYSVRFTQLAAWLYQVTRYCPIYYTPGYYETCQALSAFWRGDKKSEHTTFQRAFKQIIYNPDPRVTQVMGVFPGIGEKRAVALVKQFGTLVNIINASPKELQGVEGIGPKLGINMLRQAGRLDV